MTARRRAGVCLALIALAALAALAAGPTRAATPAPASLPGLAAATYLGGGGADRGRSVGLDAQGNVYVVGETFSSSMFGIPTGNKGGSDIYVAKLSPDARTLLGFFTVGSTGGDVVGAAAVTPQGEVVIAVSTSAATFPTKSPLTPAIDPKNPGVLLKVNAALDGLVFSTFTDFTVDPQLRTVGVAGDGSITAVGYVYSPTGPRRDMVLERFSPDGQQQLLKVVADGDDEDERPQGIAVRADGTTYVAGYVEGRWGGLAVTQGALQTTCGRRLARGDQADCDDDAFAMVISPDGALEYGTYLGGDGSDRAVDIGVDSQGAMVVLGSTTARDFPTTQGALQPSCLAPDPDLGCYYDMFVAKIAPDGAGLVYSTYLASADASGLDYPSAVAVDAAGAATVVGFTASEQWPVLNPVQPSMASAPCPNAFQDRLCFDAVVTTFAPDGSLTSSTYLGGRGDEEGDDVALAPDGSIYLAGVSKALDFPTTPGALQPSARSGEDAFLARIGQGGAGGGQYRASLPLVVR